MNSSADLLYTSALAVGAGAFCFAMSPAAAPFAAAMALSGAGGIYSYFKSFSKFDRVFRNGPQRRLYAV